MIKRYAGDRFTGLSTDTKPNTVDDGAQFTELDTGDVYNKEAGSWVKGAEANQTDAEIKTQYEANADTNVLTDNEKANLHAPNTDTALDQGGTNEITASTLITHTSDGTIHFTQAQISIPLSQASDVNISTLSDRHAIVYNNTAGEFQNRLLVEADISDLGNYLTDYTVTESDVTQHQNALSIAWSQLTSVPNYDNYVSWNLRTDGVQRTSVESGGILDIVGGTNVTTAYSAGGVVTINSSDTTYTAGTGISLSGGVFSLSDEIFTTTLKNKLDGIESGAQVNEVNEAPTDGEQYVRQNSAWALVTIPEGYDSGDFDADFSSKNTDNLSEGLTNLYFTGARAVSAIQSDVSWNAADWDAAFGWGDHSAVGYITGYTVTQSDVTAHQAALSLTESQISDLSHYTNTDNFDFLKTALIGGENITISVDEVNNTLTFDSIGGSGDDLEFSVLQFFVGDEPTAAEIETDSTVFYLRGSGTSPNREIIQALKNENGQEVIISTFIT